MGGVFPETPNQGARTMGSVRGRPANGCAKGRMSRRLVVFGGHRGLRMVHGCFFTFVAGAKATNPALASPFSAFIPGYHPSDRR